MSKNKQRLFIIIFLSVALLAFILFFYFSKQNNLTNNLTNPAEKTGAKIESQNDFNNFNKAQENNNIDTCSLVSDSLSKDFCIKEIAIKTQASSSCLLINNKDSQASCSSMILFNMAVANKNLTQCQEIQQSMLAKTCVENIAEIDKGIDCGLIKEQDLKDSCFSIYYYQRAKSTGDVKLCKQIPEVIRRANCLSELQKIDLHSDIDKDGLNFLQEIANNTNPDNPDTDGDGYKDGDEFKKGFNPDGKGSLALADFPSNIACKDIKESEIKAICFSELKGKPLDITKCGNIKDEKLRVYCTNILTPAQPYKPKSAFEAVFR